MLEISGKRNPNCENASIRLLIGKSVGDFLGQWLMLEGHPPTEGNAAPGQVIPGGLRSKLSQP